MKTVTKTIKTLTPVLACLLLLAGCAVAPEPAGPVTYHADRDVAAAMRDMVININRAPNGHIEAVMLDGFGAGQSRSAVEWSIVWYDTSGRQVTGISDRYRRMTVSPGVPFQISATAPVQNATRAHIHVRRSRTAD